MQSTALVVWGKQVGRPRPVHGRRTRRTSILVRTGSRLGRAVFACAFCTGLLLLSVAAFAQEKLGSVAYLEGDVSLVRDGAQVDNLAIGADLQNFDLVKTGSDGLAELDVNSAQSPRITIRVSADTQFSLEMATIAGRQQTTLGIIGGSISLKAARLAGTQALSVKTDSAAMGVRGTEFDVTSPATGDVLVTCNEGEVVVTDDQGKELHAIPGTVVEKRPAELYRTVPVEVSGLRTFRGQWAAERGQALEKNALKLIQANVRLYNRLVRELNAGHAELDKYRETISGWREEDRRARAGQRAEIAKDRQAIGSLLARLRRTQFQLERVHFRLARLMAIHNRGIGQGTLDGGVSTAQFFERFVKERKDVEDKLYLTRSVSKMYLRRNDGRLP